MHSLLVRAYNVILIMVLLQKIDHHKGQVDAKLVSLKRLDADNLVNCLFNIKITEIFSELARLNLGEV